MALPHKASLFLLAVIMTAASYMYCLANPLDDAQKAYNKAKNAMANEQKNLAHTTSALNRAISTATARKADLDNAIHRTAVAQSVWDARHVALVSSQNSLGNLSSVTQQLNTSLAKVEENVNGILNKLLAKPVALYNVGWQLNMECDLKSQGFNAWAEFPRGMKLTTGEIASIFQGSPTLPDFNPLELLTINLGVTLERQCHFDDCVKKEYANLAPTDRVYVSSRSLAELLSPEHAASATIDAIFTGGSTVEGSAQEVANGCLRELNAAYAFLQDVAKDEAENLLPKVALAMFESGNDFKSPTVEIKTFKANMKYTVKLAGDTDVLHYLPQLKQENDKLGLMSAPVRPGFIIRVRNVAKPTSATDLRSAIGKAGRLQANMLKRLLSAEVYPLFELALNTQADPSAVLSAELATLFQQVDYGQLNIDPAFPYCLDLRSSLVGAKLNALASKLKIGKDGYAKLSRLDVNVQTGQVVGVIDLLAKQEVALSEALKIAGKTAVDLDSAVAKDWQDAGKKAVELRKELADTTGNLGPAIANVNKAHADLNAAQHALELARAAQQRVQDLFNAANAAVAQAQGEVNGARDRVKQAQASVNHWRDVIGHWQVPPVSHLPHPRWPHW